MLISIAIGTAGVIIILTMGDIVKKNLNNDLTLIGGATIMNVSFEMRVSRRNPYERLIWFKQESVDALRKLPGVMLVSQTIQKTNSAKTSVGKKQIGFPLIGIDSDFWAVSGYTMQSGRPIEASDVAGHEVNVVLGDWIAQRIFGTEDVVGMRLFIDDSYYRIIGVMEGDTAGTMARFAYIPITTARDRMEKLPDSNRLLVRALSWDDVERVAAKIPETIAKFQDVERLKVDVPEGALEQVKRIAFWVESFIYFAVIATLVLGGYGIWNGMMTAVRSRIREIGLKKAMGAKDLDIMFQFLSEAVCLSCSAAVLGIGLGVAGVFYTSKIMNSFPSQELVLMYSVLSFLFSLLLGIIAGFYPALRASRMEVVSAIRYE